MRLHVFPGAWGINSSPFCLKVQTYCHLAGIPYTEANTLPFRAPRGKLPFIDHDGEMVPDSGLIIDYLKRRFGDRLDGDLAPEQRALGHLIRRTCEESLYFVLLWSRWVDSAGWQAFRPVFFGSLPPIVRDAIAPVARRGVRRSLNAQGCGRHTPDEVIALGAADLSAIATMISCHAFAVSDHPTSYDAVLYGFLANILSVPIETRLKVEARRHGALVAYVDRMRSELGSPHS